MTQKELLNEITYFLIQNVFRNPDVMFDETVRYYKRDLVDIIATLHNMLYEQITGKRYDYMFHWANKIGSCTEDDVFDTESFYPDTEGEYSIHYEEE